MTSKDELAKTDVVEVEAYQKDDLSWADKPDTDDQTRAPGMFGFMFKKNPSATFTADVARMNALELDPKEIKRIERRVDLLIIPALAVCYMVRANFFVCLTNVLTSFT